MGFLVPLREALFQAFIGDYSVAQPEKNTARGSDPFRLGRVVSGAAWAIVSKLVYFSKQMLPDTAEGAFLQRWGGVFAFPMLTAVGSTGVNVLLVSGTPGSAVPVGYELSHPDGTLYTVTTTGAVIGAGGTVLVSVAAEGTGLATNKAVNSVLTFTGQPAALSGVSADATLVAPLTGGLDVESFDAFRVRLLAHIGDPPEGGAIHDYLEWAKRIPGVVTAYVWTHRRGLGTIDVAMLGGGTGANRVVPVAIGLAVDSYIESVRPGGVRDFLTLVTVPQAQDVTMTIDIDDTVYKWDWDDFSIGYIITAFDPTAQTITVPSAPSTAQPGLRLTVNGEEATIVSRVGNVFTLSFAKDFDGNAVTWFTFTIATGTDTIRASGDLVTPVRNAIFALFNTLGPARSSYSQTSWISGLKLSKLFGAVTDVQGVDDAEVSSPTGNVEPVDTFGTTIPFLVPGKVQIWKPST